MTDVVTLAYAAGAVGMAVGVAVWAMLVRVSDDPGVRPLVAIPGVALVAYAAMAAGFGTITVEGVPVPMARYLDWLVTTPVMIGYVAYVADAPRRQALAAVAVDLVMILVGWAGVLVGGTGRLVAFAVSSACYVGLLVALYRVFPTHAAEASPHRRLLFEVLQNHIGLLWLVYPFVWAAGPLGLGWISVVGATVLIAFTDVAAKTPFVYLVYRHRTAFADSTRAEPDPTGLPADD